jgi:hypothetical protein
LDKQVDGLVFPFAFGPVGAVFISSTAACFRQSPKNACIMRLIGAAIVEQNDVSLTSSRYMMIEAVAQINKEEFNPILSITTKAA